MLAEDSIERPIDRQIVSYFREKGCITPAYARERLHDEGIEPKGGGEKFTRGYVGQRIQRFEEHGHAENLYDTGLYEWVAELDGADR